MLDPMKLTGEENVSVVNRITGKRVGYMFKISTIKMNMDPLKTFLFDGFYLTIFDQFLCIFINLFQ